MPVRYRDALIKDKEKASLVVTIDPKEPCLLLYQDHEWQCIETKLQQLPSFNEAARRIQRLLIGHANDVDLDNHGRMLLPALLRDYAKLEKHVVLIGQGNKFEIWAESIWEQRREQWLAEESVKESIPEEMKTFSL